MSRPILTIRFLKPRKKKVALKRLHPSLLAAHFRLAKTDLMKLSRRKRQRRKQQQRQLPRQQQTRRHFLKDR